VAVSHEQVEELDLQLGRARLRAQRFGPADAPLTACVHGLSANKHGFDYLGERLAGPERQVLAVDLRGRGRSERTPPGTYGVPSHAEDVLEAATAVGAERFDYVGWSMGAMIGMQLASNTPQRVRRLVLIDLANRIDEAALEMVVRGLDRLDAVVSSPEEYVGAIRDIGTVEPWSEYWDRYFAYELGPAPDGLRPRTSKEACLEDLEDGRGRDWSELWPGLTMPTLLVRATVPLGGGFLVPDDQLEAMRGAVPRLEVAEVERNHYTVVTDDRTVAAIREFLDRPEG
jgi:pimeloyl-ACP methyl ester carboxylesterase